MVKMLKPLPSLKAWKGYPRAYKTVDSKRFSVKSGFIG